MAFGLPGAHVDGILQDALDAELRIVDVRHEMNAGHAAEGYARVTGELGVAVVTAGGGFTNVLTSITNAYLDRTAVLYITGSGPLETDQVNDQQAGFDQVAMAAPVTRFAHRVTRTALIPRLVAQAIRIARSEPKGPVLLDIPWDVLRQSVDVDEVEDYRLEIDGTGIAPTDGVDRIIEALSSARRPIALVGKSFVTADARARLHGFAARTGVPLFSDWEGLGAIVGSEQHVGLLQTLATVPEDERPDLVLLLGLRFGMATRFGTGRLLPKSSRIFQIDPDGRELGRLQDVELGIQADPVGTLGLLNERLGDSPVPSGRDGWLRTLRHISVARRSALAAETERHEGAIHPYLAVRTIAESVPDRATVVVDGALTELWLSETIALAPLSHYLGHGYLSAMGSNFGVALGAQYANPDKATILVTGDGAVGYSLAEFDSLVRAELPVVVIVLNNRAWGATLHTQQFFFGQDRVTNNRLENGSYSGVARALGADGVDVTELDQLRPAIEAALAARRPTCIDVRVSLAPIPPEERVLNGGAPFGGVEIDA
ncbi:thiamine pyrophosphate-binding protein [Streptomyces europaeiscabiei]|uniref:thiamine pyrophosphate-binding protein n=1 Tax=Streptomyces europaeiscabiei TaxID=146819 RepID=UPI0029AEA423|nr:thiamine pyrophosphate-binding protein [Streptomyces europaeiscabiei]MDX3585042.1 thiamine pyrophosphate-binding protein [Streptomyces europaeiscabiei]MDX3612093.1 thiamine pyrophosphate-binding protein [Streptomyces europaeiscabiei]